MGIIQFLLLTIFVLTYVMIVGGLLARMIARNVELKKHSHPEHEEALIGG